MQIKDAIALIEPAVSTDKPGTWADLGAGTGMFTQALLHTLPQGSTIYALDKSPMLLYQIPSSTDVPLQVVEGDFTQKMDLPLLDGIVLANALHYAKDQAATLKNILHYLKPEGVLILVEYELEKSRSPWVPYPISFRRLQTLAQELQLRAPQKIHQVPSAYGYEMIYAAQLTR